MTTNDNISIETSADVPADRLERVRKLLAKAERAGTLDEAEIYMEKAVQLIAKHGISEALLQASTNRDETPTSKEFTIGKGYADRNADLLCNLGHVFNCQNVVYKRGRRVLSVELYGYASDIEQAELLWTSLWLQAVAQVTKLKSPDPYWETTQAYRNSWLIGYGGRVTTRLKVVQRAAAEEAAPVQTEDGEKTGALVLVERKDRVTAYFEELHPNIKKWKGPRTSGSGMGAGRAAGDRADIGQSRVGGTRKAIR